MLEAFGAVDEQVRRMRKGGLMGGLPGKGSFRVRVAPRFMRDASKCDTGVLYDFAVEFKGCGDRDKGKRIGQAVADLQISIVSFKASGRQFNGGDKLVRL